MKCNVFLGWSLDKPDRSPGKDCWLVPDKSDENIIFLGESVSWYPPRLMAWTCNESFYKAPP